MLLDRAADSWDGKEGLRGRTEDGWLNWVLIFPTCNWLPCIVDPQAIHPLYNQQKDLSVTQTYSSQVLPITLIMSRENQLLILTCKAFDNLLIHFSILNAFFSIE